MSLSSASPRAQCTPEQVDEAAVWMTLLRASTRNEQTEAGFRRWLAADPAHRTAFEKVSAAFEVTAALPKGPFPHLSRWQRAGYREGFIRAGVAAAAVLLLALTGAFFYWRSSGIGTKLGEQRTLALEDGTQVYLNTDTRIRVDYNAGMRRVDLKSGEAYFDVAKEAGRPFVVMAAGRTITALGTSFVVRSDNWNLTVTLLEGKVSVASADAAPAAIALLPGERAVFHENRSPQVDRPQLGKVVAWRTGHVEFEKTPLTDAIAEMNRYSPTQLVIERDEARDIPITGIFRAGASKSFAVAVADAYGLELAERPGRLELSGLPRAPSPHSAPETTFTPK